MENNNNSLDLRPPSQHKPGKDSFKLGKRAIKHWLASLPTANLNETGTTLLEALTEVNQLQIRRRIRFGFLESVRSQVHDVVNALERMSLPRGFPPAARNLNNEQLADALLREQAIGYRVIVQELSAANPRQGNKQLAVTVQRSIHTLSRLLVHRCSRYQSPPKNLWRYLHEYNQIAERYNILHRSVPDPLSRQSKRSSTANAYKQILLLAAAGPYRMRHNEIEDAYALFERWAPVSRLIPVGHGVEQSPFLIDLESDKPPSCQRRDISESSSIRLLDTSSLPELAADERLRPRWWSFQRQTILATDPGLVQRLIIALGMPPVRQSIRLPTSASAQVLIGLPQIHRGLAAQRQLEIKGFDLDESTFTGRDLKTGVHQDDGDIWELIYPSDLLQRTVPDVATPPADRASRTLRKQDWQLINASHGGYCLLSDPKQMTKAQINELVALRERGDERYSWQIGVIRWMRQLPEGLQIGVQILGAEPYPALGQAGLKSDQHGSAARVLLLPANDNSGQPATLLTSPLQHAVQQHLKLSIAERESDVLLTHLIESCSGFSQFEYQTMASPAETSGAG